jgi:hypothetical protein
LGSLLLFTTIYPTHASSYPLSIDEYWRLVEETRTTLANLEGLKDDEAANALAALAVRWDKVNAIRLADGQLVQITPTLLITQLRNRPPDPIKLGETLESLIAAHNSWPQAGVSPNDIKTLDDILSAPEFQWGIQSMTAFERWLNDLMQKLAGLLDRSFQVPDISLSRHILPAAALLVIAITLFFVLRSLQQALVADASLKPGEEANPGEVSAEGAFRKAQELGSAGSIRQAVRYLYLSTLLTLDEKGWLRYDRSQTNREYLRSLEERPQLQANLGEVIDVFDRVWYGLQPLEETDFHRYADRVAELRKQR